MDFPNKYIFEDISMSNFKRYNKKNVTEDFVAENFREIGWKIYKPFSDSGIDLIITKRCCPKGDTEIDENVLASKCKCGESIITIKRFLQIKTRELKDVKNIDKKIKAKVGGETQLQKKMFGYTLKSKDFRTDPRHTFVLYSDSTNDLFIIPIFEYLHMFYKYKESAGSSHFGTNSFRQGINKLNSLIYFNGKWTWSNDKYIDKIDFEQFRNIKGLNKILISDYDTNNTAFITIVKEIARLKLELFYSLSKRQKTILKEELPVFLYSTEISAFNKISEQRKNNMNRIKQKFPEVIRKAEEVYYYADDYKEINQIIENKT